MTDKDLSGGESSKRNTSLPTRQRSSLEIFLTVTVMIIAVGYTLSSLVITGPKTPITVAAEPVVSKYMYPHFFQNWSLFAPDPISEDRGIVSKVRCSDGSETDFQDLSTDLIDGVQSRRLFGSREFRVISNSIVVRFREDDYSKRLLKDEKAELSEDAKKILEVEQKSAEREADTILANYSAAKLEGLCDSSVDAVKIRYVINKFPGWSSKSKPNSEGQISYIDTEWITPR